MDPLVLLHGALGAKTQLLPLQAALEERGRVVYSFNFSGHNGQPFAKSFGIETFAEDLLQFIESKSLQRIDIFGYSMGGYVALWFALHYPACVNKIFTLGTKFDWSPESARSEGLKLDPEKIFMKVPAFARILEHRHAPNNWKELLARTSEMMLRLGAKPLLTPETISKITQQVWVLLGDADDMADRIYSEKVATLLPQGQFMLLNNTPHPIEKVDLSTLVKIINQ